MAIFHLETIPLSRSYGRSAIAAAAYRSGTRLEDVNGRIWNYEKRRCVEYSKIIVPEGEKQTDRQTLWSMAELNEKRCDARTARQYEVALPSELPIEANFALARELARLIADRYHVAVDVAVHAPHKGHKHKDGEDENENTSDPRNVHIHLLATTRVYHAGTLGEKSYLEWDNTKQRRAGLPNGREQITALRETWASMVNAALTAHGEDDYIYAGRVNSEQQRLLNEHRRLSARLAEIEALKAAWLPDEAVESASSPSTVAPMETRPEPEAPRPLPPQRPRRIPEFRRAKHKKPETPEIRKAEIKKPESPATRRALVLRALAQRWRQRREEEKIRRDRRLRDLRARQQQQQQEHQTL